MADVLIVDGFHVPVILLFDFDGSAGGIEFSHNGPMTSKVGEIPVVMVMSIVAIVPHPDDGVNVYMVVPIVDVLIVDGFHVPVILLLDVVGRDVATEF